MRNKAGVKPVVEGPGSEKRTFFRAFRGVVVVVVAAVLVVVDGPLGSEPACFATWLLVRDAGERVSISALLLEMELLRRFRVSLRFILVGLVFSTQSACLLSPVQYKTRFGNDL